MRKQVKCLVWDLDETLWSGTLVEGDAVILKKGVPELLTSLTKRGILNSIASRNDHATAMKELERLGVDKFFIAPCIDHSPKPDNLQEIAQSLNISVDSLAFIDNDPFERAAVTYSFPDVLVINSEDYLEIPSMEAFQATGDTAEACDRVKSYRDEAKRSQAEAGFSGSRLSFLKSCKMDLTVRLARAADAPRVVELAERTNQFNSSGVRYSADEVLEFINDPDSQAVIGKLSDRFGDSGIIAAMILRRSGAMVTVESLMVSCRVDGRGIPSAMLALSMRSHDGMSVLQIRFNASQRNRRLLFLYQMMGFSPHAADGSLWKLEIDANIIPEPPEWLNIKGDFPRFDS
ncbi:MAG: HAD-IIIC family phosphatase [Verrucomicrobiota bacterium]